ncbi:hypothetical protein [Acaryochloris sp. CCMEE 5410]|uniref:hypothetical protein n=1 Tax=Acaryochloris sp. CCMEE 5410 TaxID=310037 RepID=UPI0002483FCA|nr:hypothetical protein [Acaryochloris sp. CCMEE 5410]KAI9129347.1 hypothetical protein ON05_035060 [Acaryochloris sp. CCMEE 5410]
MSNLLETPTTVNELEKWIDAQVTDPLHPEMVMVELQIEQFPGVREGGDLFEVFAPVICKPGLLRPRLEAWVKATYGNDHWLANWRTVPSTRQLKAENDYKDEI